ncbi:MAG: UDP-N-acetylmuramoyl-tripeptide--D-alanyl-D-alanine ligase [Anaeromyxobacter sp.]|nr:UDP-N-acetylmuramoyl-tripeptide--D-alanyl-D-alanine ligase [Anaeromyxobacter sp.]MBL0275652.1 UDP-N-acetylmuramoyl-tripeptide--D-alanyl-D-alanine ligase [Anaeromyxobacter sp.]
MIGPRFTAAELAAATGGRWLDSPPPGVEGLSTDTRAVVAGSLFVALRGERFDAHAFLGEASRAGAAAALVHDDAAPAPGLPRLLVGDTLAALGAVARHHRRRFDLPVVAVTGSNGKTTTREMTAAILATRGPVLKTEGNLNNEVGVPLTLLRLTGEHRAAVIELGMNHPGEIGRLTALALPQVGVVTNAAAAHLAGLGTVDGVADAKAELWQGLPPGGVAVANADDPRLLRRAQASGRRLLTFATGRQRRGDVVVLEVLSQDATGLRFLLGVGNRELEVALPLVGAHNAANAAAAACAAIAMGCDDREIVRGLAGVAPVGRRLRLERLPSGVLLVDDCYNANPSSMTAALHTLRDLARAEGGRAVAALGDMLELGPGELELHRAVGAEAAAAGVDRLLAFGPRSAALLAGARAAGLPPAHTFHTEDVAALCAETRATLRAGDVLLVKASRGLKLERLVEALR